MSRFNVARAERAPRRRARQSRRMIRYGSLLSIATLAVIASVVVSTSAAWKVKAIQQSEVPVLSAPTLTAVPDVDSVALSWSGFRAPGVTYAVERSLNPNGTLVSTVALGLTDRSYVDDGDSRAAFVKISASASHACGLTGNGNLYCWGSNAKGQLGINSPVTSMAKPTPVYMAGVLKGRTIIDVAAGWNNTCVITSDSGLYCWGYGAMGANGNGATADRIVPDNVTVTTAMKGKVWKSIQVGAFTACAVATDSAVFCWGWENYGEFGMNKKGDTQLTPVDTGLAGKLGGGTLSQLVLNSQTACALTTEGALSCWGRGSEGQFGDGLSKDRTVPTAVTVPGQTVAKVTISGSGLCLLTASAKAYCAGSNGGNIGDGTTAARPNLTAVMTSSPSALAETVGSSPSQRITDLATSNSGTCAVLTSTTAPATTSLACWGSAPATGYPFGGPQGYYPTLLPSASSAVSADGNITQIVGLTKSFCVLTTSATAHCRGTQTAGELGDGNSTDSLVYTTVVAATDCPDYAVPLSNQRCSLVSNSPYYYRVTATAGNFKRSTSWVPTRTLDYAPLPLKATDGNQIRLDWPAVDAGIAGVTYTVRRSASASGANPTQVYFGSKSTYTDPIDSSTTVWSQVSSGANTACGVAEGAVYCWGSNSKNGLGTGAARTFTTSTPVLVSGFGGKQVVQVVVGKDSLACARTADQYAYCWGDSFQAYGKAATKASAVPVAAFTFASGNIVDISAGDGFACIATVSGDVACSGNNDRGQLGNGSVNGTTAPVSPTGISTENVVDIQTSWSRACVKTDLGKMYCWGANSNGIGVDSNRPVRVGTFTNVSGIGVGDTVACFVTTASDARCWGANAEGQLGVGTTVDSATPVKVLSGTGQVAPDFSNVTVARDGSFVCAGGKTKPVSYCWGSNSFGQFGIGSTLAVNTSPVVSGFDRYSFSTAGATFNCFVSHSSLSTAGTMKCAGALSTPSDGAGIGSGFDASMLPASVTVDGATYYYNIAFTIAGTGITVNSSTWVAGTVTTPQDPNIIASSGANIDLQWTPIRGTVAPTYTLYRSTSADGSNAEAVYSGSNTSYRDALFNLKWTNMSIGDNTGCGVLSAAVYCWGSNARNGLGTGLTSSSSVPIPVKGLDGIRISRVLVGSDGLACALSESRAMYCWGDEFRAYGTGATAASTTAVPAFTNQTGYIVDMAVGADFACVVNVAGNAWCSGRNANGQLGLGSTDDTAIATIISPVGVLLNTKLTAISAGSSEACALTDTGSAVCWGANANGQLGTGDTVATSSPVALPFSSTIAKISVGSTQSCAITSTKDAYCWGANESGQLGNGTLIASSVPVRVTSGGTGDAASSFADIWSGHGSTVCATSSVASEGIVCWGSNAAGQFGTGSAAASQKVPVKTPFLSATSVAVGASEVCANVADGLTGAGSLECAGALKTGSSGAGNGTGVPSSLVPRFAVAVLPRSTYYFSVRATALDGAPLRGQSPWVPGTYSVPSGN